MRHYRHGARAVLLVALLILAGCSATSDLNLVVGALEVAVPLIPGVPPAIATVAEAYLAATSQAIASATDILAGTGTDAEKAALIAQAFAGIAEPVVPPQYQALVNALSKVAGYVANFLAKETSPISGQARAAHALTTVGSPTHIASTEERAKLATLKARALAVRAKMIH